jgi:Ca2+-binding RTX toxin-like protein
MQTTVNSTDALVSALKTAQSGDTILLSPGNYSTLALSGVNFSGQGVTIASADPSHPASVAGVELNNSSGLTFQNLEVTIDSRTGEAFDVSYSSNIHLSGINMHGPSGGESPGLLFKNSSNVSVDGSEFHDLGTAVRNVNSDHVTISNSKFHDLYSDGIQSTGSSYVTLHGNYFTDFHTAPGDHPDAMQFFTYGQTSSAHDIEVSDNTVVRGTGDIVQGIFMGNEANIAYQNVEITGNKLVGTMYNGIAIGDGQNVEIANNTVEGYTDMTSWIRVEGSSNVAIHDNQTTGLVDSNGNTGLTESNNTIIAQAPVGDTSILNGGTASSPSTPDTGSSTPTSGGTSGSDTTTSGSGSDTTSGSSGADTTTSSSSPTNGTSGADTMLGHSGSNTLFGGGGADSITGSTGFNRINGNDGADTIFGHSKVGDWLLGGKDSDSINASGSSGNNLINGNMGNDTLIGGTGQDSLRGGQGDDVIHAGSGNDWLSGDLGHNTLVAGSGADTFHVGQGVDLVTGFSLSSGDKVQIDHGAQYTVTQSGADVHIDLNNGGEMILQNTKLSTLGTGWILQN